MSIIVTATPINLLSALGPLILDIVAPITTAKTINQGESGNYHIKDEYLNKILKKELQTNIMDKETLVKTLTEHEAFIITKEDNFIECTIENLKMTFYKMTDFQPYKLSIEFKNENELNYLLKELSEEYKTNAQEASYNQILKNLKTENYDIEQEEILEDNTIVLTVNLE